MAEPLVLLDRSQDGVAVLALNRPASMNALSSALCSAISEAVEDLSRDELVRVLIVTGSGRAFCAGLDLKEIGAHNDLGAFVHANDPVGSLSRFRGPVIGAINGAAITGGFELALACDVLIASTEAKFADTHARVGVLPGWGLSQKLSRTIGPYRAREISLTGNFLDGEAARAMGLVNRVVAPDRLLIEARDLAAQMLSVAPEMLREYKSLINVGYELRLAEALVLERERFNSWSSKIEKGQIEQGRAEILERGRRQESQLEGSE